MPESRRRMTPPTDQVRIALDRVADIIRDRMPLRLQPVGSDRANHLVLAFASLWWGRPELAWTIPVRTRCATDTWFGGSLASPTRPVPPPQHLSSLRRVHESRGPDPAAASDETRNPHQRSKPRNTSRHSRGRPAR